MPPRYAYWTIIVDNQPTAFRAGSQEDLMPTFKRLKEKHPSAAMMWFQNGKLWPSRIDAQEAMRARGEMGRRGDKRQDSFRSRPDRAEWRPKSQAPNPKSPEKLDWKPKGEFTPAPKRAERPDWKPKTSHLRQGSGGQARPQDHKTSRPAGRFRSEKPEWKPKGSFDRDSKPRSFARPAFKPSGDDSRSAKPEWKPKGSFDRKAEWKPKGSFDRDRKPEWKPRGRNVGESSAGGARKRAGEKLEWKPKTESRTGSREPGAGSREPEAAEKRKWVPKAEYKKSQGIEAKRDSKWRPGGEHRDPRQKYKDAKKAKWTKFKKTIRTKWEAKTKKKS